MQNLHITRLNAGFKAACAPVEFWGPALAAARCTRLHSFKLESVPPSGRQGDDKTIDPFFALTAGTCPSPYSLIADPVTEQLTGVDTHVANLKNTMVDKVDLQGLRERLRKLGVNIDTGPAHSKPQAALCAVSPAKQSVLDGSKPWISSFDKWVQGHAWPAIAVPV